MNDCRIVTIQSGPLTGDTVKIPDYVKVGDLFNLHAKDDEIFSYYFDGSGMWFIQSTKVH